METIFNEFFGLIAGHYPVMMLVLTVFCTIYKYRTKIKNHAISVWNLDKMVNIPTTLESIAKSIANLDVQNRMQTQLISSLLELNDAASFLADVDGNCIAVNSVWVNWTGLSEKEALGQGWVLAIHEDDRVRVLQEWDAAIQHKRPFSSSFRYLNVRTKEAVSVITRTWDVQDERGKRVYIIGLSKMHKRYKALIIDDEEDTVILSKVHANRVPLNVNYDHVKHWDDARPVLERNEHDMIFLDLKLGNMSTEETLSKIPTIKYLCPDAVLTILTGMLNVENLNHHPHAGLADFKYNKNDFFESTKAFEDKMVPLMAN